MGHAQREYSPWASFRQALQSPFSHHGDAGQVATCAHSLEEEFHLGQKLHCSQTVWCLCVCVCVCVCILCLISSLHTHTHTHTHSYSHTLYKREVGWQGRGGEITVYSPRLFLAFLCPSEWSLEVASLSVPGTSTPHLH